MTSVSRGSYPFSAKPVTPNGYDDSGKRDPSQSPLVINAELLHDTEQKRRNADFALYKVLAPENTNYVNPGDVIFMHKSEECQAIYKQTNIPGEAGLPGVSSQLAGWGNKFNDLNQEVLKLTKDVYVLGTCPNPRNTPYDLADGLAVHVGGTANVFLNYTDVACNERLYAVPPLPDLAYSLPTMDYGKKINLIVVPERKLLKPALKNATIAQITQTTTQKKEHGIELLAEDHGKELVAAIKRIASLLSTTPLRDIRDAYNNNKVDFTESLDDLISAIMGFKTTMTDLSLGTALTSGKKGSLINTVLHKH